MNAGVFVYTGAGGDAVPQDVVRIQVNASVTSIPAKSFYGTKLAEVELCEGLVEIGDRSFAWCNHSITKINIPNSLRRIKDYAFISSIRTPIRLPYSIESIGEHAFVMCIFTNFRVPPLITVIPDRMLYDCATMFSLELSENMREIRNAALRYCHCLRNLAFPPNAVFGDDIFIGEDNNDMTDLRRLFGNSNARIISELRHRFDGLPIHKLVYYQSYYDGVLQNVIAAMNMRSGQCRTLRSKLDQTGNHQDSLGMTPLHILACSSVHNLELYRVIVEKYPANLITEDRWGTLPLLYAFWGAAPNEIIHFLVESYESLYPGYVFNWTMMVETMGRCDTPKERIENLLCVRQMRFPEQPIDWEYLLNEFAQPSNFHRLAYTFNRAPLRERMQFLFTCGMSDRMEALPFKVWRNYISNMIQTSNFEYYGDNLGVLREIQSKLARFEVELPKLKEVTTILEIALWKMKMNQKSHQCMYTQSQKKMKTDEFIARQQCRVTCGADVVIGHVLPFLISV